MATPTRRFVETYNASGGVERETHLNPQGAPVKNRRGFASVTYSYDSSGSPVGTVHWDELGGRAMLVDGYSAIRREYNERRLEVETAYLDSSDRPVPGPDGYATVRYEYDERGFVDGHPAAGDRWEAIARGFYGYGSARIKRNEAGQRLEMSFFDERGAPAAATRFGSARRRWTYDEAGRVAERSDHDVSGRPIINAYG